MSRYSFVKLTGFIVAILSAWCAIAGNPEVVNVTAKQRYPWNGLVDITCKVTGIDGTDQWKFSVAAVMPDTGNARNVSQFWLMQGGTKSTDVDVYANGNYRLLWDAQADLGQVIYSNLIVRVTLVGFHEVQLWEGGPYWATRNIGAEKPEDYGYYFWWGDTRGYKYVHDGMHEYATWVATDGSPSDFRFNSGWALTYYESIDTLKSNGWITAAGVLAPAHDAAHVHWGGEWRMPTDEEFSALVSHCTTTWTTRNRVYGLLVTGKGAYAGRSIFLPAAGGGYDSSLNFSGSYGYYWSSTPGSDGSGSAWYLIFNSSNFYRNSNDRYLGRSVRPVRGFAK